MTVRTEYVTNGRNRTAEAMPEKWKKTIFSGVFFLTFSNLLTKLCGLFLKVPLTNTLGDTGMAYFNLAYTVYKWFYMISTAGLPVAAAVLTAESIRERAFARVRAVRDTALLLFCGLGTVGSLLMALGAPMFAALQKVPEASMAIAAIAPALFCICVSSALRGWYQGLGELRPAAVSQVTEAAVKMVCGLLFGGYALRHGYALPTVAAFAVSGLSAGCFLGMLVMLAALPAENRAVLSAEGQETQEAWETQEAQKINRAEKKRLLSRLFGIALPVTVSASVLSLSDLLDSMIVIRRMTGAGVSAADALRLYGSYTALAVPMFNLPPVLIYPVTTALIPVLAGAAEEKRNALIRSSIRLTAVIALPCAAGMTVLAEPILRLFYRADLAATGAPLLTLLAPAVFFLSMLAVSNAVLQAAGHADLPVCAMAAGALVKLVSGWFLTGTPGVGILGTPVSTVLCYLVMAVADLCFVVQKTDCRLAFLPLLWKPLFASLLCAGSAEGFRRMINGRVPASAATLCAVAVGGIVYLAALVLLRGFPREEFSLLPIKIKRKPGDAV